MDDRRRQLKNLILLGKERGYLTYTEIGDHLPDDMRDQEQVEGIASMIREMNVAVYDEAPKPETLLVLDAQSEVLGGNEKLKSTFEAVNQIYPSDDHGAD